MNNFMTVRRVINKAVHRKYFFFQFRTKFIPYYNEKLNRETQ